MTSIHKIEDEPDFRFGFSRENTVVLGEGETGMGCQGKHRQEVGSRQGCAVAAGASVRRSPLAPWLPLILVQDSRVAWWPQGTSGQLTKQCQWLSPHVSAL